MWLIIWAETHSFSCTIEIKKVCGTRDVTQQTFTQEDGVKYGKKLSFQCNISTTPSFIYKIDYVYIKNPSIARIKIEPTTLLQIDHF